VVDDRHGGTGTGSVAVTVTAVARAKAPIAVNDIVTTPRRTTVMGNVLTNDTDADTAHNLLRAVRVSGTAHGSLTLQSDGRFTYTPADTFSGTDTFRYTANDGTLVSNIATVTITVTSHFPGDHCDHDRGRKDHHRGDGCEHDRYDRGKDDHDRHRNGHYNGDHCEHDRRR